jgi:tRNA (guanine37-N1)-methyltransferase
MRIDVLTLFPEMFAGPLSAGVLRLAQEGGLIQVHVTNIRDFGQGRHRQVDDKPFGGGPGMLMKPEPVVRCVEHVRGLAEPPGRLVLLTPQGRRFDQAAARELAAEERLVLVCGRYEGFDERIRLVLNPDEISIGDYVLSGGEVPALVVIDATVRLLPGALGAPDGAADDSFAAGLLEGPQFTRPRVFRGLAVPDVLVSGNHARVADWRRREARRRTAERRADLLPEGETAHAGPHRRGH